MPAKSLWAPLTAARLTETSSALGLVADFIVGGVTNAPDDCTRFQPLFLDDQQLDA